MLYFKVGIINNWHALNPMQQEFCQSDNGKIVKTRFNIYSESISLLSQTGYSLVVVLHVDGTSS